MNMQVADKINFHDGIHGMVTREKMCAPAIKLRNTYAITPNAPIVQKEFGYYCLERWKEQGLDQTKTLAELFGFDPPGEVRLGELGWCSAQFEPVFETKIIEDRGDCEIEQDKAGRHVLYFKGRRNGFMPEYVDHPVKDMKSWEENVKWRLNPNTSERYNDIDIKMKNMTEAAGKGMMICQNLVGGYMYLRSLIGPEDVLYKFYDEPNLIHDCMQTWFNLADKIITRHQEHVTLDELFLAEDICYNNGPLISPDMMREFLFPYYQQLICNIKSRQIDKKRHLFIKIDTDGFANPVIPVYQEIGMDAMVPFEVASGCDVVEIGKQFPNLFISGGIDKRILAEGKDAIKKHLDYILPTMHKRGGYIPTCDHGVPEEVSLDNYMYYRKLCLEYQ